MIKIFNRIVKSVKAVLFPIFCLSCRREGFWVCPACLENLKKEVKPQFFCPHCHQNNENGRVCLACRPFSFLDGAASLASYGNEIIAGLIQSLKYKYAEEVLETFDELAGGFSFENFGGPDFFITPVPLHRRRYLERGFNQAGLIAGIFAKRLSAPTASDVLVRARFTPPQVGLGPAERKENIRGAFQLRKPPPLKIILIDDVFTTGETLRECARTLKEGGAKEVLAWTAAREI